MREIKFRAWDKKQKEFHTWEDLKCNSISVAYLFNNTDLKLLQYTGLKDKNNKEVYEGDILQVELDSGYVPAKKILNKVYFENGCFKSKDINSHEDVLFIELPSYEAVGNIYENPELLEKDK